MEESWSNSKMLSISFRDEDEYFQSFLKHDERLVVFTSKRVYELFIRGGIVDLIEVDVNQKTV